ncbi:MAG: efflux RND transporter permease subunit [Bacteroidota bacterium]
MNLPNWAIRNAAFVIVLVVLAVAMGALSFISMPRSEDPKFSLPNYTVVVVYPGTSPADMEELIADPIEEVIDELDDITEIVTELKEGLMVMVIEGRFGVDPSEQFDEIVREVNTVRSDLPDGIVSFEVKQFKPEDRNVVHLYALTSDNAPYAVLQEQAEILEGQLEKVQGVKKVDVEAYPEEEVRISLDFQRMANQNIPLTQVIGILQQNNANIPGGEVNAANKTFSIKTTGGYKNLEDIKNTVVSSGNGKLVYLRDIAKVEMNYEDWRWKARLNKERVVFTSVKLEKTANILQVSEQVQSVGDAFQMQLPANIELETAFEQASAVEGRINGFFNNLLQGVLLVGLIIFLFLGWRASSIIITIIPLCIVIALAILNLAGYGLQQLSIAALVIALGLLVDNGIVVLENISRFLKEGYSKREAAAKGAGEVAPAIISSTATTLLAFFPLTQLGEGAGEFLRSLPLTVIFTLVVSLILALTLSPLLASRLMKLRTADRKPFIDRIMDGIITKVYRPSLNFSLRFGWLILLLAVGLLAFSVSLFPKIGVSFFPTADKPMLLVEVETPYGSSLAETSDAVEFVENVLDTMTFVKSYTANIGHGNPQVYYNRIPESFSKTHGQVLVNFTTWQPKKFYNTLAQLRSDFENYPNAEITFKELKNGAPVEAPIEIRVLGEDSDTLKRLAAEVEDILDNTAGVINVSNPLSVDKTQLKLSLNKEKAGMIGLSYLDFDRTVRASLNGLRIDEVALDDNEKYAVTVRLPFDEEPSIDDFNKVYFATQTGAQVPLRQVANLEFQAASTEIRHFNLDRNATVTGDVVDADATVPITVEIIEKLDELVFPKGYSYYVAGEYEDQQSTFGSLGIILILAQVGIFAVLVLQFRSVLQPLIVFSSMPLAITGSFIALYLSGWSFSFFAFVGLISLIGIVVNNAIILIDYINQLRDEGRPLLEAIRAGSERRFTPIILTSITTILGLIPLTAQASTLWSPLGLTIIGGMISSTFLTLLVVPILYKWFSRKERVVA